MTERVVLAFSGGLDTSVAIPFLAEKMGAEVVAVAVDLGQGGEDMEVIRKRALDCGAVESVVVDAKEEFAADFCVPALQANALYMDRYPLVSALSRPLIVKHLVAAAKQFGGTIVSHGCTGKGNDQVRFEAGLAALAPDLKVVAPARDYAWTRDKAIEFAEQHGLPIETTKKNPYSIDQNLWGRAVETGFLEDIWNGPDRGRLRLHRRPRRRRASRRARHHLRAGRPGRDRRPDAHAVPGHRRAQHARRRAGRRPASTWSRTGWSASSRREVYEAPGAIALITAHPELENVTVERDLARFKRGVDQRWSELVYDGLWFSPLKRALDALIADAQKYVSGDIRMTLHGGRAAVTGRALRAVPVRLLPRHLRHRRHLRPVAGQGLRELFSLPIARSPRRATQARLELAGYSVR